MSAIILSKQWVITSQLAQETPIMRPQPLVTYRYTVTKGVNHALKIHPLALLRQFDGALQTGIA
jgi:hypothetical protein